ncbi:MAG: TolC family protein [Betaproteobacteria bacterium]
MALAVAVCPAGAAGQTAAAAGPAVVTLKAALAMARQNSPELAAAAAGIGEAHAARAEARAALLPSLTFLNTYTYTQPNGTDTGVFIANNGRNEYFDQAAVHAAIGVTETAGYRSAAAAEAVARAQADIAARGVVVTVVQRYDAVVVSQRKLATARQAEEMAQRFLSITRDRERGGESAHSDVIKAQILLQQRQRQMREAELALNTNRNELAIVIFPTYQTAFNVEDDLETPAALPEFQAVQATAVQNNPDVAAAAAALRQAEQDVWVARGEILPSLSVDYFYGIDANNFAVSTRGIRNLGSSVAASVNVPLWNWGATGSRIAVAHLRARQAGTELAFAQRQLLADLHSFYEEAQAARAELDSLKQSADLAAESLRLTTLRYQAGEATVLEVVDAQTTLTDARNAYDEGQARYHLALANLQTLTGTF